MERTFDRRVQFDERSRAFPIRALVGTVPRRRSYTWGCSAILDQGSEGACVGFAWAHELAARPVVIADASEQLAHGVYSEAKKLDAWPGEDYSGTSVLAGAKAVTQQGWMGEYRWAFGLDDLILAVGYKGPAVLGVNWYEGMFNPDDTGFLRVSGALAGGHAILCRGVSISRRCFLLHNSWGPDWGAFEKTGWRGTAWITFEDMERLLHEDGEACIPVRRQRALQH